MRYQIGVIILNPGLQWSYNWVVFSYKLPNGQQRIFIVLTIGKFYDVDSWLLFIQLDTPQFKLSPKWNVSVFHSMKQNTPRDVKKNLRFGKLYTFRTEHCFFDQNYIAETILFWPKHRDWTEASTKIINLFVLCTTFSVYITQFLRPKWRVKRREKGEEAKSLSPTTFRRIPLRIQAPISLVVTTLSLRYVFYKIYFFLFRLNSKFNL